MIHSNLRVEVHGPYILVAMRGTCLMAKYGKQELLGSRWTVTLKILKLL